ncbi:MAG: DUF815 domain-containing protein, partial [Clostridia bacterium]|nr:DUF815 domain-containing protein [Clostridia bacterium]
MDGLKEKLYSLTVFRDVLKENVTKAFLSFLEETEEDMRISAYSDFVSRLYAEGYDCLSLYVRDLVFNNENVFVKLKGEGKPVPESVSASVERELAVLSEYAAYRPLPGLSGYRSEKLDLPGLYRERAENIGKYGYGIYAKYHMFTFNEQKQIVPVKNPDKTTFSDLWGYEREHKIVVDNTKALLAGKPAANILLTGDAGTGKSSTVKATVNALYGEGLRVLEITKEQLKYIPIILEELCDNPLKFIIFIDDLSFGRDDDNLSALKAVLEGSVSAKTPNVVIYATSNRRHIVKESFSDRDGDDIHRNDTIQELISLSDRFGI